MKNWKFIRIARGSLYETTSFLRLAYTRRLMDRETSRSSQTIAFLYSMRYSLKP
ncbi:four helix bundle protein [Roseofilum sp. Guam]|uniref:four helix bundle protein n=1 Tax=Roseofilum sp. Guam TaxID=2821502 RepID=UPI0039A17B73